MSRARAQAAAQLPGSGGFVVDNIKKFGSTLAASLSKQLEMKHLRAYDFRIARGESLRIADAVPLYRDEGQQFPVLQIKPAETSAGAYLEVALDYEHVRGACGFPSFRKKVRGRPIAAVDGVIYNKHQALSPHLSLALAVLYRSANTALRDLSTSFDQSAEKKVRF